LSPCGLDLVKKKKGLSREKSGQCATTENLWDRGVAWGKKGGSIKNPHPAKGGTGGLSNQAYQKVPPRQQAHAFTGRVAEGKLRKKKAHQGSTPSADLPHRGSDHGLLPTKKNHRGSSAWKNGKNFFREGGRETQAETIEFSDGSVVGENFGGAIVKEYHLSHSDSTEKRPSSLKKMF